MALKNGVYNGFIFLFFRPVNDVMFIFTLNRAVGRNFDTAQTVNVIKLGFLGHGGAGHAGKFRIQTEIVLESDGSQGLVFRLDLDTFFGFNRLVQTVGITTPFHHTAGKFVNNHNLAVFDDVVNVADVHFMRPQSLIDIMNQGNVVDVVKAAFGNQPDFLKQGFDMFHAFFGQNNGARLFILFIIFIAQFWDDTADADIFSEESSAAPEIISGVRASSIKIESTSSTMA